MGSGEGAEAAAGGVLGAPPQPVVVQHRGVHPRRWRDAPAWVTGAALASGGVDIGGSWAADMISADEELDLIAYGWPLLGDPDDPDAEEGNEGGNT